MQKLIDRPTGLVASLFLYYRLALVLFLTSEGENNAMKHTHQDIAVHKNIQYNSNPKNLTIWCQILEFPE